MSSVRMRSDDIRAASWSTVATNRLDRVGYPVGSCYSYMSGRNGLLGKVRVAALRSQVTGNDEQAVRYLSCHDSYLTSQAR